MKVTYEFLRDRHGVAHKVYREGSDMEYFSAYCPWHDDDRPSLLVYKSQAIGTKGKAHNGWWKCLAGCGVGGLDALWDAIHGERRKRRSGSLVDWERPRLPDYPQGLWAIADTAHRILKKYPDLSWYLEARGLGGQIDQAYLGYHDGWITVPVFDEADEIKTLILRATPPIQDVTGYRFASPRLPPTLYVPNWKIYSNSDRVAVVFGMFDALTLADLMIPVCTPTHGNESIRSDWFYGKSLVVFPDGKQKEIESAERFVRWVDVEAELAILPYKGDIKDPNGWFEAGKRADLERIMSRWF